jgi:hypothetical protein
MTALLGTNLAAPVVPFDSADTYPTHDSIYGIGGWREVADTAARDAIPAQRRRQGMIVWCVSPGAAYQLAADLTTWNPFTSGGGGGRYDIGVYFPGKPDDNQFILELAMVTTVTLVASLTGSKFKIRVLPSATMTFALSKNGTFIGSVSFNTSGVPSVSFASSVAFAAGDVFGIQAPSPQDASGADISFTFVGSI